MADNLFASTKGMVRSKNIDAPRKLYEIVITLYNLTDETNYGLGQYTYSAIDTYKNKQDDG